MLVQIFVHVLWIKIIYGPGYSFWLGKILQLCYEFVSTTNSINIHSNQRLKYQIRVPYYYQNNFSIINDNDQTQSKIVTLSVTVSTSIYAFMDSQR